MQIDLAGAIDRMRADARAMDVSIVMPCLNESISLPVCIANAQAALVQIEAQFGLRGEIVIADNGSTDGSQQIAESLGARVVPVVARGYGAALIGGCHGALGRYILMGDADGSYNFLDGVAMIGRLVEGADLCMGSRFMGGIAPGAMPWKNRYIGNPVLTGILNLFFRSGVDDAHCGIRAISKEAFLDLDLTGAGMEFASEMIIKASLRKLQIDQVPATLSPDLRDRPPHLRPWRDGWRHLRYLLMLSPTWVFGVPALLAMGTATLIFAVALLQMFGIAVGPVIFGTSWSIIAGFLFVSGHFAAVVAAATHFHGVKAGYRTLRPVIRRYAPYLTLETMLIGGLLMVGLAVVGLSAIGYHWTQTSFAALNSTLPLVLAATLGATGLQTALGGFMIAIIAGNTAAFGKDVVQSSLKSLRMVP